jgi:hypothetical protein
MAGIILLVWNGTLPISLIFESLVLIKTLFGRDRTLATRLVIKTMDVGHI